MATEPAGARGPSALMQRYPLPYAFARSARLLLERQADGLTLWHDEQPDVSLLGEVIRCHGGAGQPLQLQRLPEPELMGRISNAYSESEGSAAAVVSAVESDVDLSRMMQELPAVEDLLEAADDAPIIRMLNALLTQAARDGASDIHVEPYERHSSVRFRVDGALRDVVQPNRALHAALISRLKIMADLDIAEKRLPQDGRISLRLGARAIDVRVSTLPSAHGERAVLRLLDKSQDTLDLEAVGMQGEVLARFEQLIAQPHGIILVTGPTGSGKTTTLYASLTRLNARQNNIMTVEDPIEYDLPGVAQTQVNPRIELTFARALRAILRQDPDIVMIGEIRDMETAQIAIQASLTGHLVLATLHTNDAASAITRLTDMGVEPFLLSSSLLGALAQRLVRKLCTACHGRGLTPTLRTGVAALPPEGADPALGRPGGGDMTPTLRTGVAALPPGGADPALGRPGGGDMTPTLRTGVAALPPGGADPALGRPGGGVGCDACSQTGYQGRTGVFELLVVDERIRSQIHGEAPEAEIRATARANGMRLMREDGERLIAAGLTSREEVLRVTDAH